MNRGMTWLGGLGLGAGLMYLLDPDKGHARRIRLRNKAVHAGHVAERKATHAWIGTRNRTRGAVIETIDRLADLPVPDSLLVDRVRAKMGHFVQNAHAVSVAVNAGVVTLEGQIRPTELNEMLKAISSVRGVERVENRLEPMGIDDRAYACCDMNKVSNMARKVGAPLAIGMLAAAGFALFARMREMEQMVDVPALTEIPPRETIEERVEPSVEWVGEPVTAMREAA